MPGGRDADGAGAGADWSAWRLRRPGAVEGRQANAVELGPVADRARLNGPKPPTYTSLAERRRQHRPRPPDELAVGPVIGEQRELGDALLARLLLTSGISGIVPVGTPVRVGGTVVWGMPSSQL